MCLSLASCLVWKIVMSLISQKRTWYYQALRKRTPSVIYCARNHFFSISHFESFFSRKPCRFILCNFIPLPLGELLEATQSCELTLLHNHGRAGQSLANAAVKWNWWMVFFQDCFCRLSFVYVEFICSMGLLFVVQTVRMRDDQRKGNIVCCRFQIYAPSQASLWDWELPRFSKSFIPKLPKALKPAKAQERRN